MAEHTQKPLSASRKSTLSMGKSDKGLSSSLLAGSEEVFECFCQPCSTENLHTEAAGFCTVCKEYLCDTCFKYHRKITATKRHKLLGKDDMPKITIVSKQTDKLQKTCPTQADKLVDQFCNLSLSATQDKGEAEAQLLGEVHVKTDEDTRDCKITGIAALPGGRIVLIDNANYAIKLVDTRRNKVTFRLQLTSASYDVVTMAPDKVAAAMGDKRTIELFTVTDTLSEFCIIFVGMTFDRFCFDGEKFIIVATNMRAMMILDVSEGVSSTVSLENFYSPWYVAVGRNSNVVYITDKEDHTVTAMHLSGQIISVYKNDLLNVPSGVTVGSDNSVYVCSLPTHTVHHLTATGELVRIILDQQRGLAPLPAAIAYDDEQDVLYISSASPENLNVVRYFKLQ